MRRLALADTCTKGAIPEHLALLRSLQFVSTYRKAVWEALEDGCPRVDHAR